MKSNRNGFKYKLTSYSRKHNMRNTITDHLLIGDRGEGHTRRTGIRYYVIYPTSLLLPSSLGSLEPSPSLACKL